MKEKGVNKMVMFGGIDCYYCGKIKPLEELNRIEVWEESGKSGGSMTFHGSAYGYNNVLRKGTGSRKGGGVSYNTGRVYYRKQKVYACDSCLAIRRRQAAEAARKSKMFWTTALYLFLAICVILYFV